MPTGTVFAFDLDGTVTAAEILPGIAREAGLFDEISRLTAMTLDGALDFESSFRQRFALLRHVPVETVRRIVAATPLDPHIAAFIRKNRACCSIITGNVDCWITPLTDTLGCALYCSRAEMRGGELVLASVLDKGQAVRAIAARGKRVIAIGDAANDIPMFLEADMGIAYGGVRRPAPGLLAVADGAANDGRTLCDALRSLQRNESAARAIPL